MCAALKSIDTEFKDVKLPDLEPCDIGGLGEDTHLEEDAQDKKPEAISGN